MTKDLIELYAKREKYKGISFQKIHLGRQSLNRCFHIKKQKTN